MANRALKLAMPFNLAVFTFSILLASCNFGVTPETKDIQQVHGVHARSTLDRKDVLALWHLAESHITHEDELRVQVQEMLQFDAAETSRGDGSPVSASVITGVHQFSITVEDGFSSVTANCASPTNDVVVHLTVTV